MNAFRTVLTHFSQRYPGLPTLPASSDLTATCCIAFDGMRIRMADLLDLPSLMQAMDNALTSAPVGDGDDAPGAAEPVRGKSSRKFPAVEEESSGDAHPSKKQGFNDQNNNKEAGRSKPGQQSKHHIFFD
jgi:hypothetical protein